MPASRLYTPNRASVPYSRSVRQDAEHADEHQVCLRATHGGISAQCRVHGSQRRRACQAGGRGRCSVSSSRAGVGVSLGLGHGQGRVGARPVHSGPGRAPTALPLRTPRCRRPCRRTPHAARCTQRRSAGAPAASGRWRAHVARARRRRAGRQSDRQHNAAQQTSRRVLRGHEPLFRGARFDSAQAEPADDEEAAHEQMGLELPWAGRRRAAERPRKSHRARGVSRAPPAASLPAKDPRAACRGVGARTCTLHNVYNVPARLLAQGACRTGGASAGEASTAQKHGRAAAGLGTPAAQAQAHAHPS